MTSPRFLLLALLLVPAFFAFAQTTGEYRAEKPIYRDEIIPLRGKPFKGKILKFEGSTMYVEITKHKITQVVVLSLDSLREVNKDFGPTKISIWKRKPLVAAAKTPTGSPTINLPTRLSQTVVRDTAAALEIERDSIYVGAVDRKDTSDTQSSMVDQKPIPLVRGNTEYPPAAVSKRMEGIVKMRLWIDRNGIPQKYEVLDSTDPLFIETSVESAMKWEFSPAVVKGTPVGVWASVTFEYRFQK